MAKDFNILIRLHQWIVDEKRRVLGALLGEVASLETQATELEREIVNEQEIARAQMEEVGFIYGPYAEAAVGRRHQLADDIEETEQRIAIAQEDMREEYRSLKTFELSQEARDERETKEMERREQAFLDELGLQSHRRRRRAG